MRVVNESDCDRSANHSGWSFDLHDHWHPYNASSTTPACNRDRTCGIEEQPATVRDLPRGCQFKLVDDLGKRLAQRDEAIEQLSEDLRQKHRQHEIALSEAQAETSRRSAAAEQRIQELVTQKRVLIEQQTKLDVQASEQERQLAERAARITSLQGELDAGKRQAEELKEQYARVTTEAAELRSSGEQERQLPVVA